MSALRGGNRGSEGSVCGRHADVVTSLRFDDCLAGR
jgi:hypothetical protein